MVVSVQGVQARMKKNHGQRREDPTFDTRHVHFVFKGVKMTTFVLKNIKVTTFVLKNIKVITFVLKSVKVTIFVFNIGFGRSISAAEALFLSLTCAIDPHTSPITSRR